MEKKDRADLIVMAVMFLSALLVITSGVDAFGKDASSIFTGASIMFAAALVCRAMQWADKE